MATCCVIYGPPTTTTSEFNQKLYCVMDVMIKEDKVYYQMCECNINIQYYDFHFIVGQVVNIMYKICLYLPDACN